MTHICRIICAALLLSSARVAAEPMTAERVRYVSDALAALRAMSPKEVVATRDHVYATSRSACRSAFADLGVRCLIRTARARCDEQPVARRAACHLVADVAITNRVSEGAFVSNRTRYELMKRAGKFRVEFRRELRARYAELAAELAVSGAVAAPSALAPAIASYCAGQVNRRGLSWQRCAAALVWYVATVEAGVE